VDPYLALFVLLGVAYLAVAVRTYRRVHALRVVHCPAAGTTEAVRLAAGSPSLTLGLGTKPHVAYCSLWPTRQGCAQQCLAEIEVSPDHCAFQLRLEHWYEGKRCAFCRREIPRVQWGELKPSLLSPGGRIVTWSEVAPAALDAVLRSHAPVCAHCDVAETFRRQYPDLVTERPARPRPSSHA
jgi:hypothetical protein